MKDRLETIVHHSMAVTGGFFGVYALLNRSDTFGSSETSNLIFLIVCGLDGSFLAFAIRLGSMLCYIAGIVFATLAPKYITRIDFRYISIGIDMIACVLLALIPPDVHPVIALYPMFFATAIQWLAFTSAAGFNSATIFSTNNLRQCFAGLTEYVHNGGEQHLKRFLFFGGTLICFHVGVVYSWFCMHFWGLKSILACLLPLTLSALATRIDCKQKEVPET